MLLFFDIGVNERHLMDIYVWFQYSLKAEADFEDLLKAEKVKDVIDFLYIYWRDKRKHDR